MAVARLVALVVVVIPRQPAVAVQRVGSSRASWQMSKLVPALVASSYVLLAGLVLIGHVVFGLLPIGLTGFDLAPLIVAGLIALIYLLVGTVPKRETMCGTSEPVTPVQWTRSDGDPGRRANWSSRAEALPGSVALPARTALLPIVMRVNSPRCHE